MDAPTSNPAGRLHNILTRAVGKKETDRAKDVWAEVLETDSDEPSALLPAISSLIEQIGCAKDDLRRIPDINHDPYEEPLRELEHAFIYIRLEGQWKNMKNRIGGGTLTKLRYTAEKLDEYSKAHDVDMERLHELKQELDQLIDTVMTSELPWEAQRSVLRSLEAARRAIIEYKIRGVEGVEAAAEMAFGTVLREHERTAWRGSKDILRRMWTVATGLHALVAAATGVAELPLPDVSDVLSLPSGGE